VSATLHVVCPMNLTEYIFSLQQAAASATTSTGGALSPTSNPYLLSDSLLKNITLQLASALHHIHTRDLIHLDVKPENVLVSHAGILRLADFGQARIIKPGSGDQWGDLDGVEGDSIFMAPELLDPSASGESGPTSAADIFSLGLLLVELASGVMLPKSGEVWHDLREGRAHQHVHSRVSAQMEHIILNLLEPKPSKRPTAKQIIQWLEAHHDEAQ
jgi:serine/threonine protein kinase